MNKRFFLIVVVFSLLVSTGSYAHEKDVPVVRSVEEIVIESTTDVVISNT